MLGSVIQRARPTYQRAKRAKSTWTERHALLVWIDAAEESLRLLPGSMREPWLLAQLSACLEITRKWRRDSSWIWIEPCLVNSSDFTHTISMLTLAERMKGWGHEVQIIPHGQDASPDLRVRAIGGRQEWLQIECYQPRLLSGKPVALSTGNCYKIIKEAMKKGRRQLGGEKPGIIAICMYNQKRLNIQLLKAAVKSRLRRGSRESLAGFILMCQNNLQTNLAGNPSFTPGITLDFVQNPGYFGGIEIRSDAVDTAAESLIGQEIKESLREVVVNDFVILLRELDRATEVPSPAPNQEDEEIVTRVEKLTVLNSPVTGRAIFSWSGDKYSAFMKGDGNIDFQCGGCGCVLAKAIWKLSCSNIILRCPKCNSYNEFPQQTSAILMTTNNIAVEANDNEYRCASSLMMKRGICIFGVEHDYHLRVKQN